MSSIAGSNVSNNNSVLQSLRLSDKISTETKPAEKPVKIASDSIVSTKIEKGIIPSSAVAVATNPTPEKNLTLKVGANIFTDVHPIVQGMDLEEAKNIIKENKIDEIIFKTEEGKLYIANGSKSTKGALNLDDVKGGHIGKLDGKNVKIVHISNETNTTLEGAKSPLVSTWKNIKEAGATGITKGIAEMGTTVVAIFIGKSIVQNGMSAVQTATTVTEAAGTVAKGVNVVKGAGGAGKAIVSTVGSGLKQVGAGVAVAGAVVGTVAVVLSAFGAISGSRPKNDFTTIEMLTDPSLAFIPKEKVAEKK